MDFDTILIYLILVCGIAAGVILERHLLKRKRSKGRQETSQNTHAEEPLNDLGAVETKKREDLVNTIRMGESLLDVKEFHQDPKIRRMIENGIERGKKRLLEEEDE